MEYIIAHTIFELILDSGLKTPWDLGFEKNNEAV